MKEKIFWYDEDALVIYEPVQEFSSFNFRIIEKENYYFLQVSKNFSSDHFEMELLESQLLKIESCNTDKQVYKIIKEIDKNRKEAMNLIAKKLREAKEKRLEDESNNF